MLGAAEETGLVKVLNEAGTESSGPRLANSQSATRQQLLLTLLFMNVFEVRRAWDLCSYSGDGLALLSEWKRAYGYVHTERFLAQIAQSGAAERLTDSLGKLPPPLVVVVYCCSCRTSLTLNFERFTPMRFCIFPDLSNCGCLPGTAGGLPI